MISVLFHDIAYLRIVRIAVRAASHGFLERSSRCTKREAESSSSQKLLRSVLCRGKKEPNSVLNARIFLSSGTLGLKISYAGSIKREKPHPTTTSWGPLLSLSLSLTSIVRSASSEYHFSNLFDCSVSIASHDSTIAKSLSFTNEERMWADVECWISRVKNLKLLVLLV